MTELEKLKAKRVAAHAAALAAHTHTHTHIFFLYVAVDHTSILTHTRAQTHTRQTYNESMSRLLRDIHANRSEILWNMTALNHSAALASVDFRFFGPL